MKKEMVLEALVDILDTEMEFTEDTVLEDIDEWDSLAKLYLVAFAKKECDVALTANDIKKFKTIKDICNALSE